eukprot:TRINITY_DN3962_c0_g1_i2.p1 TRINITY_DN3962_c0_g1~~TRINITY_DN3962_c0_g1_i2.p1  ORF type:complete len:307 (-),score=94.87 TRINITY_DN3962_c0_g1_i2:39-959(-)
MCALIAGSASNTVGYFVACILPAAALITFFVVLTKLSKTFPIFATKPIAVLGFIFLFVFLINTMVVGSIFVAECTLWYTTKFSSIADVDFIRTTGELNVNDTNAEIFAFNNARVNFSFAAGHVFNDALYCVSPIIALEASEPTNYLLYFAGCQGSSNEMAACNGTANPTSCMKKWHDFNQNGVRIHSAERYNQVIKGLLHVDYNPPSNEITSSMSFDNYEPVVVEWRDTTDEIKKGRDIFIGLEVSFNVVFIVFCLGLLIAFVVVQIKYYRALKKKDASSKKPDDTLEEQHTEEEVREGTKGAEDD